MKFKRVWVIASAIVTAFLAMVALAVSLLRFGHEAREDVAGEYQVSYPFGEDVLQMHADGSYRQETRLSLPEETLHHEGRWELRREWPGTVVIIQPCFSIADGFGQLRKRVFDGGCTLAYCREHVFFGRRRLGCENKRGYVKTKRLDELPKVGGR